ncbi:MAG: hypothetical protein KTV77_03020 [Wolbachia endosymbiont of Fragariocoptes setiger]|nr:hypothetical protein [Wolbachia endosymbiont of Fragariocoptes setiger]
MYKRILTLCLIIIFLKGNLVYGKDKITVGLFQTKKLNIFNSIFNNLGVKTVIIDCDELSQTKSATLNQIKTKVAKLIDENNINRIFSSSSCQVVTEDILEEIASNNPSIHFLSGFDSKEECESATHKTKEIKIVPGSHLSNTLEKFLIPDKNGWISILVPAHHSKTISNNPKNRSELKDVGYKVVGFANNGDIEIVEDKHGNIHFQNYLIDSSLKSNILNLITISIIYDFLYRN